MSLIPHLYAVKLEATVKFVATRARSLLRLKSCIVEQSSDSHQIKLHHEGPADSLIEVASYFDGHLEANSLYSDFTWRLGEGAEQGNGGKDSSDVVRLHIDSES